MRNIFDQYSQPENKLTHALACCLNEDHELLKSFVKDFLKLEIKNTKDIKIVEQTFPDNKKEDLTKDEDKLTGLPDALIYVESEWCIVIENKISCGLTEDQLSRHVRSVKRYDFKQIYGVTFTISNYQFDNASWKHAYWTDFYIWLKKLKTQSKWVTALIEYLEVLEMKLANDKYLTEGTLTTFTGIPFNKENPYNYLEGKRVLKLLMQQLRTQRILQELGIDLNFTGRGAITNDFVWDCIPVKKLAPNKLFTSSPHFTISLRDESIMVNLVIPDGVTGSVLKKIQAIGSEGFSECIKSIVINANQYFNDMTGISPQIELVQRHFKGQKVSFRDALLVFDMRTAFGGDLGTPEIKTQPEWLKISYEILCSKKSNLQLAIGIKFNYDKCKQIHTEEAIDLCTKAILCCKDFMRTLI